MPTEDDTILRMTCSECLVKWNAITFKRFMRHYHQCRRKKRPDHEDGFADRHKRVDLVRILLNFLSKVVQQKL